MLYIGMDVHSKWTTVAVLDGASGELRETGKVMNEQLRGYVEALSGEKQVALEAGRNSFAIADQLLEVATVVVADPTTVRKQLAGEPKTDRRDAKALAMLLAQGRLRSIYVPDAGTRELRELTRGRTGLVQHGSRMRQRLRGLLARWGQEVGAGDLLGKAAQKKLATVRLPPAARQVLELSLHVLKTIEAAAQALEAELVRASQTHKLAPTLLTLPGVGAVTAMSLLAEIGDVRRFRDGRQLCAYSGLVPSVKQSGGRCHTGPLTKRGNGWLRTTAVLAANQQMRIKADSELRRYYYRHAIRLGANPAKVATARKFLHVVHSLLMRPRAFVRR